MPTKNILKDIIEALKEKPCSKKELIDVLRKNLRNKGQEALRKRCERFLRNLQDLGLVEKREDKYYWYFYPHLRELESYQAKVEHSKRLIPALLVIAEVERLYLPSSGLSGEELKIFMEDVEQHLQYYEEIWGLLEDYRSLKKQAEERRESFVSGLKRELKSQFGEEVREWRTNMESFVSTSLPWEVFHFIHEKLLSDTDAEGDAKRPCYKIGPEEVEKSFAFEVAEVEGKGVRAEQLLFDGYLVARGSQSHRVKEFIKSKLVDPTSIGAVKEIRRIEHESRKRLQELQDRIMRLKHRIESGEPLTGECRDCPKILVADLRGSEEECEELKKPVS